MRTPKEELDEEYAEHRGLRGGLPCLIPERMQHADSQG